MQFRKVSFSIFLTFLVALIPFVHGMTQVSGFFAVNSTATPNPYPTFTPFPTPMGNNSSCLNRTNIANVDQGWTYIPKTSAELYSEDNLQWLAGRLILSGIVDATGCPANGLASNSYANTCGMTVAKPTVVVIQNSLNQAILDQYAGTGVPPVMLKQLIRTESQFWPSEDVPGHYGLGQVTNIGASTALYQNPQLLAIVCGSSTNNCIADDVTVEMMFSQMVNTCTECKTGINTDLANRSVNLLANVVYSYCDQTTHLIFNATGWRSNLVVDYGTLWKLSLMNYNAGATCVYDSVRDAFKRTNGPIDWPNIVAVTTDSLCKRGISYANQVTRNDYNFPPSQ